MRIARRVQMIDIDKINTEWNKTGVFIDKTGEEVVRFSLPPFAPKTLQVQGRDFVRTDAVDEKPENPIVYHEA
jgi:hypothetical protein